MTIKCVIMDLGDVIIDLDFSRFFNDVITPSPLNKPQTPIMLEFFRQIIDEINLEMVDLIKKIKTFNSFKLICMSNINSSHWSYLKKQKWDIWDLFDEFILSHEIHLTKPDPKVFELAIKIAGCKPKEILFIDDGLNNIRSASEMGINSIRYMGLDKLVEELLNYGIKMS